MHTNRLDLRDSYIPTLDGWRALAILLVVLFHTMFVAPRFTLFIWGGVGVHLFFVISGFLITSRLYSEARRDGSISIASFYKRRAFRILPAAFFYLLVLYVLGTVGVWDPPQRMDLLAAAAFFRNYYAVIAKSDWQTIHYWSLSVEEHFYLIWPFLFALLWRSNRLWTAPALALTFTAWRIIDWREHILLPGLLQGPNSGMRTDYKIDIILWGCTLACWFAQPAFRVRAARLLSRVPLLLLAGVTAVAVVYGVPAFQLSTSLLFCCLICGSVLKPQDLLSRFLELRVMVQIGKMSYSIYIWQQLAFWDRLTLNLPLRYLLLACTASVSYYIIEKPMIRLGKRLGSSRSIQEPSAMPLTPALVRDSVNANID